VNLDGAPIWICETKTSSEDITPGSDFWRRTVMDTQISAYLIGARSLGWNAIGCLYDVLGVVQLQPKMATPVEARKYVKKTGALYGNQRDHDETPEEFGRRCLAEIISNPARYFQRGEVVRLEAEHAEAAADMWATAITLRGARQLNMYPRNPGACIQWSRSCEYLPICCKESSVDDSLLYVKVETEHEELQLSESGRTRLTQSSLRVARSCMRKYQLRYVFGIRSRVKAEPLRRGTSVHGGVEILRKTGNLETAISALDQKYPYKFEREKAMLIGYLAQWGVPKGIVAVEQQFEIDLINPETGRPSKTFTLAGKFDAACHADKALLQPVMLEQLLEQSIAQAGPGPDDNDAAEVEA
jgi:hypothetical protein